MADLKEPAEPRFTPVYQLELTDRVRGGPGGISNRQAEQLVERTGFLKKKIDDILAGVLSAKSAEHLAMPRNLAMTGDGTWSVTFDGSGNASGAMTLANTGVTAGGYGMVTVDAKGRVTAGRQMAAADVPELDWNKITTGRPSTLEGYGITDAASKAELRAAISNVIAGAPGALDTLQELAAALDNDASFAANLTKKLASKADKAATLAGYGIADALPLQPDIGAPLDLNTVTASGYYHSAANDNAVRGRNWPCQQAGQLFVRAQGEMVYQQYQAFADAGCWYRSRYLGVWSTWRRHVDDFELVLAVPPGQIAYFGREHHPPGWLRCDGSYVSRTTYAALYDAIGDTFPNPDPARPNPDPANLFCLPELRGEFIRSWDAGRGVDPGRVFGSRQDQSIQSHTHQIWGDVTNTLAGAGRLPTADQVGHERWLSTEATGGAETRPRNVALHACIKY
ncbi:tail fiber protein [Chromobacterium sp. CV08]|uniref:tail fiber protein n=1 Tax=Chromobacterium sp. CV08 TaxID=3133274 RepID=UPI003DA823B5